NVGAAMDVASVPGRSVDVTTVARHADTDQHRTIEAESVSILAKKHGRRQPQHHGRGGGHAKGANPVASNPANPNPNTGTTTPTNPNTGTTTPANPNSGLSNPAVFASQLQGSWRVNYDVSATYGPGSQAVQEITFQAPGADGFGRFTATTGLAVP